MQKTYKKKPKTVKREALYGPIGLSGVSALRPRTAITSASKASASQKPAKSAMCHTCTLHVRNLVLYTFYTCITMLPLTAVSPVN